MLALTLRGLALSGLIFGITTTHAHESTELVELLSAAEQGDADAQFKLGLKYHKGEGVPLKSIEAIKWYRLAAEQDHAGAQFKLGEMYVMEEGGLPEDYVKATKLFRAAAEQGHIDAQIYLSAIYYSGRGVPRDNVEAVKWLRFAAEQGQSDAQYLLSRFYVTGQGVPQDYVAAYTFLILAITNGDEEARNARNYVASEMTMDQIAEAKRRASEWKPKTWEELKESK